MMVCLLAAVLAEVMVDRACLQAVPAAGASRAAAAARPAPPAGQAQASGLASGACLGLAPTGGSRDRTVFIDAGHGGPDPGVTARAAWGATLRESVIALAVANELGRQLRADGYRVVLSRTGDTSVLRFDDDQLDQGSMGATQVLRDLQARVRCANSSGAAVLLSIHFNGYADSSASGTQTIYDAVRPFAAESERLAQALQSALVARLQRADRGVVTDDALQAPTLSDRAGDYGHLVLLGPPQPGYVDTATSRPGALVEPLFLSAPGDAAIAGSAAGQRRIAGALAAGLEAYLSSS
jgi:N-acetylmuramoyl-L-alanine amidase